MTEDVRGLLGGYATGNLTAEERQRLFHAALADPAVFEALAGEEELRELLEDSGARARLLDATQHGAFSMRSVFREWLERTRAKVLVVLGMLALVAIGGRAVWEQHARNQEALHYQVLRTSPAGITYPVPPDFRFSPGDRVGLRIQPKASGLLQVRDESNNLIYSGRPAAGDVVTIPATIPLGDAGQRSFAVRLLPSEERRDVSKTITVTTK
jgi:hypothetical protein